jgi:hypothetical protein
MSVGRSMRDAVRSARDSRGGQLSVGGAAVIAVGVLLAWLAARSSSLPPVRATGVAENLPRTPETPPI